MERRHSRGFSLVETLIAVAIAIVIGWLLFSALSHLLLAGRLQSARDLEQSTVSQLTDNFATEEDDAWAIYVPPTDVFGASNADGHEVDFFARDSKQQPYFWAYTYDASGHAVTRYRFTAPGSAPTSDVIYSGITSFAAHTYPVTGLQDATTPIYSTLYNGAALQSGIVHFYPSMPWIAGGNNITYVHFEGATLKRDLELVTQTAPSGFTVVLNYTPSPSPTPAAAPSVFPAAIVFAAPNMTLAAAPAQPMSVAMMLNALLGGGVAYAQRVCPIDGCPKPSPIVKPSASPTVPPQTPTPQPATPTPQPATPTPQPATPTPQPATPTPQPATPTPPPTTSSSGCASVAYADAAMTQRLPAGTVNPYTGQVVVDSNGCYSAAGSGASVTVHEVGYVGVFNDGPGTCGTEIRPGGWTPTSAQGPTASQTFTASAATSTCALTFVDGNNRSATAYAAVMFPSPMYAQVNSTDSTWTYDCLDRTPQGVCVNGGWQGSSTTTYIEYVSTDQGTTWTQVASCSSSASSSCPYAPQFVDTQTSCTQDKAGGPCGAGSGTNSNKWSPYAPPNAP